MGAMKRHILTGVGAAVLLIIIYLGIITWAEGLAHSLEQTARLWYWVLALAVGFGIQVGLFSFVRQGLRERRASATASVAASGGISAGSMAACCAHHLTDILPILGLSGLSAFFASYQTLFIVIGVLSNIVGITIMLEVIQRHGLSQKLAQRQWNMGLIKKGTMVSAVLIIVVVTLSTLLLN